jgi:hypothetical protein
MNDSMNKIGRIIAFSAAGIIVIDALGALASRGLGFSYRHLIPVSFLTYVTIGFFVAKYATVIAAILAAAITGFVEATIGWAVSWNIGPGRPTGLAGEVGELEFAIAVALTIIFAVLFAATGGVLGGIIRKAIRSTGRDKN